MELLIKNIVYLKKVFIVFILLFHSVFVFSKTGSVLNEYNVKTYTSVDQNPITNVGFLSGPDSGYNGITQDSIQLLLQKTIEYANNGNAERAIYYAKSYISATGDMSVINDHVFSNVKNTDTYQKFKVKYVPKVSIVSLLYIYAGFLGFFVFAIMNIKKSTDKLSTLLISLFVLFHSIFILHLSLYVINYQYHVPQSLYLSTTFSFLYGPLLYFYFKRVINNYKFKWTDAVHLIPSVALFFYIFPYYALPNIEKFNLIFNKENFLLPRDILIIIVKICSLSTYAYLVLRLYIKNKAKINERRRVEFLWQRNIISFYVFYVITYIFYAGSLTGVYTFPILFHVQILVMVGVIFYVTYIAYVQPEVFKGEITLFVDPSNLFKYKKSGLTPSYSLELKENLLQLLNEDKIYRENAINLEGLSEKMNTTRHNASQVINEHFNMNFSELMNKYRINEAAEILKNDEHHNLSIIQIAYEVGFNNKVSFNKSFKKQFELTPSQFIKSARA